MVVPAATPFHDDETINFSVYEKLLSDLADAGVHAILLGGSTGEYSLMSIEERKTLIEFGHKTVGKRTKVIAGCSCARPRDTADLLGFSEKLGIPYGLVLPPYYMQTSEDGIYAYYEDLENQGDIGIFIYHYPGATGVRLTPEFVVELARLPHVVGIKDTDMLANTAKLIQQTKSIENFSVINGEEYNILGTLALGGAGCMGILFNLVPREMVALYNAMMDNDVNRAREINSRLMPLYGLMEDEPYPGPIKAALAMAGYSMGSPRKPIVPASDIMKSKLMEAMTDAGLL
jgi:4-hydroxy-tetrahydrodipicolinate synthase